MKLLKLSFKNLNSFVGDYEIDFTDPNYRDNGIFAITGPTGSGKTTILDAVTLALYRRTPRLGDITGTANEMMSRHTGECGAEVEFETVKGSYRATFLQHRAGRKPDGKLQNYTHELVDIATGKPLLQRGDTAAGIEAYTGMDFSRFTRSIMLAQGSFDAFLKAKADERSPILEQITGTGIYAEISQQVHVLKSEQDSALDELLKNSERIALLSPEDEQALLLQLADAEKQEADAAKSLKELTKQCEWLNTLRKLRERIVTSEADKTAFDKEKEGFAPQANRLARAESALLLSKDDARLLAARDQVNAKSAEKDSTKASLPTLQKALASAEKTYEEAKAAVETAKHDRSELGPTLKAVRALDSQIANAQKSVAGHKETVTKLQKELDSYTQQIATTTDTLKTINGELQEVDAYLRDNDADKQLLKTFSMIRRDFDQLKQQKNTLGQIMDFLQKAEAKQASAKSELDELSGVSDDITKRKQDAEQAVKAIRGDLEDMLKGRDIKGLQSELETLRTQLASLAGALELIKRNTIARNELEVAEASYAKITATLETLTEELADVSAHLVTCNRDVDTLIQELSSGHGSVDLEALRTKLVDGEACPLCGSTEHPYAGKTPPELTADEQTLKEKSQERETLIAKEKGLEVKRAQYTSELKQLGQTIADRSREIDKNVETWKEIFTTNDLDVAAPDPLALGEDAMAALTVRRDDLSALLSDREEKEAGLKKAQAELDLVTAEAGNLGKAESEAKEALSNASADVGRFEGQRDDITANFDRLIGECQTRLKPFGITDVSMERLDDIRNELVIRNKTWQQKTADKEQLGSRIQTNESELQKLNALKDSCASQLEEAQSKLAESESECADLKAKRQELLGDRDPDEEDARLDAQLATATDAMETARAKRENQTNALKQAQTSVERLTNELAKSTSDLDAVENVFQKKLASSDFTSEDDYRGACLSDKERTTLKNEAARLKDKEATLSAVLKEQKAQLLTEETRALTKRSVQELQVDIKTVEAKLVEIRDEIGKLKARRETNDANRNAHKSLAKAIDAQRNECTGWARLHALIGSNDGKKYRNFAQGITFDIVISHANRQLAKMTDRYLLVKNEENPLDLDVVDNYQAGEIRTTKNLSGGESFIVSLALALGLSNMSSKTIRVDTMFLDEGFGTLDEDALDTALEALAELHEDGKLIGVISHVPALKERISTQLEVLPGPGGRSQLSGPGVS